MIRAGQERYRSIGAGLRNWVHTDPMGSKRAVLVGFLCLLASVASADISRLSPSSFNLSGEDFLNIFGTDLTGTVATLVVFDGVLEVEPSDASPGLVISWVPIEVLLTAGTHTVEVHAIDAGGVRVHGPATFTVQAPIPEGPPLLGLPENVVAEAESPAGANVVYTVSAISVNGDDVPVVCSPPSGSHFPFGPSSVFCSATDAGGTSTGSFPVLVSDTTPPELSVPSDITSADPVVAFSATAVDAINGPVDVSCSPASGSTFATGTTTVRCTAVDSSANLSVGFFRVIITTGPPVLALPEDILAEATGPDGAVVTYEVTSEGGGTLACTPASGSTFALGTTAVSCTATNGFGSTTGGFNVTVHDPIRPELTLPSEITVETSSPTGVVVTFVATAYDLVDGDRPVDCVPASGSNFPLGVTTVSCTASDTRGNVATGTFDVTVNPAPVDTTPPTLTLPGTITAEATSPGGAIVTFVASATDDVDGPRPVTCAPASGSAFALGTTTVTCSASDTSANVASGSFLVVVQDTTPPTLSLPSQETAEATSPAGATVIYVTSATDIVDGSRPVDCAPPSGSIFALGTTTVACSSSDTRGNTASGSFDVMVEDTTPPEVTEISASPNTLWPPNHKMVDVTISVTAVDTADPATVAQIVSVSSNQPVNGTGDGDTAPDWQITGPLTLKLRAERAGGSERVYTITVEVSDASGNRTSATVTVRVSASKGRAVR